VISGHEIPEEIPDSYIPTVEYLSLRGKAFKAGITMRLDKRRNTIRVLK